jgi:hypothetical protein
MRALWDEGVPSENEINRQIDKVSELKAQKAKIKASSRVKTMKVLTSDQLDKFDKIKVKANLYGKKGSRRNDCPMHERRRDLRHRDCPGEGPRMKQMECPKRM